MIIHDANSMRYTCTLESTVSSLVLERQSPLSCAQDNLLAPLIVLFLSLFTFPPQLLDNCLQQY